MAVGISSANPDWVQRLNEEECAPMRGNISSLEDVA
jgi:hypothetical protein